MTLVAIARLFLFVREVGGQNRGLWVSLFLRYVGWTDGPASWCCAFVCFCLGIYYGGNSPLIKTAGCDELLADCRKKGFIVDTPQPGDLVFSMNTPTDAHHVAICTDFKANAVRSASRLFTIAGNTSADGISVNGDRVAEHEVSINKKVYARLPKAA